MYDTLISFDFDGTLFYTPESFEGKKTWKKVTGMEFPYTGWWGKAETLDTSVFNIPINPWVYSKYLEAKSDPKAYVILATGRLQKVPHMRQNVEKLLSDNNLEFDEVQLNWGGDTYNFKTKLYEERMAKLKVNKFIMYDDRHEHIVKFKQWAVGQRADIEIIDVTNKKISKIENL